MEQNSEYQLGCGSEEEGVRSRDERASGFPNIRRPSEDVVVDILRAAQATSLLEDDDLIRLMRRIEAGVLARDALSRLDPRAPSHQRYDLRWLVRDGVRARDAVVAANMRLAIHIARRFSPEFLPLEDRIQEGAVGLMRAIERFDYRKGYKFSTYATWWIRQTISRAEADQGRTIRLPVHMHDELARVRIAERQLERSGEHPSLDQLAEALYVDPRKLRGLLEVRQRAQHLEYLEVAAEDELAISDDYLSEGPDQWYRQRGVRAILSALSDREALVLRERFGFSGEPRTLEQIGEMLGVTRERIRQIEQGVLKQLRHPVHARRLRGLLL